MCDYSMMHVKSRAAQAEDRLVTTDFGSTRGFADPAATECKTAVCIKPGTEIAFEHNIVVMTGTRYSPGEDEVLDSTVAIFRQVDVENLYAHHDVLELPNGKQVKCTDLKEGQCARVLTLPAAPKTAEEAKEQERAEFV
jgi:hypothetical protein